MKFVSYVFHGSSSPCPGGGKRSFAFGGLVLLLALAVVIGSGAVAVATTYTLNFDGNGSSATAMSDKTDLTDSSTVEYTLPDNTYTLEGYTFAGWATTESGTVEYTDKQNFTSSTNPTLEEFKGKFTDIESNKTLTLYAVWLENVKYLNDSNAEQTAPAYTEISATTTLTEGWYVAKEGTITIETSTLTGDVNLIVCNGATLNVKGDITTDSHTLNVFYQTVPEGSTKGVFNVVFTVTFNSNGGTEVEAQTVAYAYGTETTNRTTKITAPTAPTKDNFIFAGWFTGETLTTEYDFDTAVTADITLYAKWKQYTITLNLNGGTWTNTEGWTGDNDTRTYSYTTLGSALELPKPTREKYTFAGWIGTDLTNAQETVEIPTSSAKDLTYTATWWRRSTTTTAFTPNSDGKPEVAYHSMVLGGQISVMFYVYFPDDGKTTGDNLVTHENSTISFIMSGATEPESYNIWTNECKKTLTDGTHTFYGYECFISSIQMADDITVKLTCTNNDAYKDGVELQKYKASTYLSALKGEEAAQSVEAQALGVAIMDYGHYVQVMLNGKNGWKLGEDHEAIDAGSSELTESDANLLDTHSIISTKEAYDTNIAEMKFSLLLDYVTTLRLYLKKAEDYEGDITATLANGDTHTITAKAEETERTDDDVKGYYVLDIANIAAHELADKHIITITAGSQDFTVTLSALSYAKVILANESDTYDDAMKNAMTALCNYYTATTTYQASIASYPDYVGATDSNN